MIFHHNEKIQEQRPLTDFHFNGLFNAVSIDPTQSL